MGEWGVRSPPAQPRLRSNLRLRAEGGFARPELSRLPQTHRAAARDVRDGDSQATRAATGPQRRAHLRPESAVPEGLRIRLRRGQWHSGRGSEEAAAVVKGEERRPYHAGGRCETGA